MSEIFLKILIKLCFLCVWLAYLAGFMFGTDVEVRLLLKALFFLLLIR